MGRNNTEASAIGNRLSTSLLELSGSGIASVSMAVGGTLRSMQEGGIGFVRSNARFPTASTTDFGFQERPPLSSKYEPILIVDFSKALNAKTGELEGDLVRTSVVANQDPRGYTRRYRDLYTEAMEVQSAWLDEVAYPRSRWQFDPRGKDPEVLLKSLLGDARYFSDVGFSDWQNAFDSFLETQGLAVRLAISEIRDNVPYFMAMRHKLTHELFHVAMEKVGDAYVNKWSPDERARVTANALLGHTIEKISGKPDSRSKRKKR